MARRGHRHELRSRSRRRARRRRRSRGPSSGGALRGRRSRAARVSTALWASSAISTRQAPMTEAPAPLVDSQQRGGDGDQGAAVAVGEEAGIAPDGGLEPAPARRRACSGRYGGRPARSRSEGSSGSTALVRTRRVGRELEAGPLEAPMLDRAGCAGSTLGSLIARYSPDDR